MRSGWLVRGGVRGGASLWIFPIILCSYKIYIVGFHMNRNLVMNFHEMRLKMIILLVPIH